MRRRRKGRGGGGGRGAEEEEDFLWEQNKLLISRIKHFPQKK